DAPDAFRVVDYRMATRSRHAAAAVGIAMERSICQISNDARVPASQSWDEHRRAQSHLLDGVCPPPARAPGGLRVHRAAAVVRRARKASLLARFGADAVRDFPARRCAGSTGLVHGAKRS